MVFMSRVLQGEIVTVPFKTSDNRTLEHPALVISKNLTDFEKEIFYAVLISSENHNPEYSIEIKNEMLTSPMLKQSYFITHQIDKFEYNSLFVRHFNPRRYLKEEYIEDILNSIISVIFGDESDDD